MYITMLMMDEISNHILHGNEMISREINTIRSIQAKKGKELLKKIQHCYM